MKRRPFQVNFNTVDFRKMHGKLPRGVAIWVFYFSDAPGEPWVPHVQRPSGQLQIRAMTYLAAKDYATAEARRRGVTSIRVDANPI